MQTQLLKTAARKAFLSTRVVTHAGVVSAAVLVRDYQIESVEESGLIPAGYEVIDVGDDYLLPGLVDTHVHINEPGRTEWEGFRTATRAAAAGGYTTLVDMPLNCLPETSTVAALEAKRAAANGQCWVDWAAWGGVVADNQPHIEPLADAGVRGFKCFLVYPGIDGFTMVNEAQLRAAMPHVARTGLPLLVHAELAPALERAREQLGGADWRHYETYLSSRPDEAELDAIRLMIEVCREFGCRVHIVHLSSAEAVEMLRTARAEGLAITVETCPHYLHFAAEEIGDGATLLKCAPPIRRRKNRELLWKALKEGVIDMVVTDHSPCPPEMKRLEEGNFATAWGGIASLSVSLAVVWTEALARGLGIEQVARWMSEMPAMLAGFEGRKGKLAAGYDADIVVFDPNARLVVAQDRLIYRHAISPYMGEELSGVVKAAYVRGRLVFNRGTFAEEPTGMELPR
ncbi:MAG TPA: allantoinase AllB [Acidisarcina sp.]